MRTFGQSPPRAAEHRPQTAPVRWAHIQDHCGPKASVSPWVVCRGPHYWARATYVNPIAQRLR